MQRKRVSRRVRSTSELKKKNSRAAAKPFELLENRTLLTAVNPNVIDLFMAYTATARADVGSQALMVDKINRSVSFLNQAMANSKVNVAVRLVGTMETNYPETGVGKTDLDRLVNLTDGQLDDVTNAAIAAGADVTDLVVDTSDVGGITQGNYNVDLLQFLDNGVFSHEFGHTLGGDHPHGPQEDGKHSNPAAYEGTMNFNGNLINGAIGGAIPYYSNPNVLFRGQPTGIAGTGPTAANNAQVMNANAATVAGFRAPVIPDTTGPVAQVATVSSPIGQNVINFLVRFGDGSGVNVDSLGNNNIVVTGPNGFSAPAKLVSVDDPSVNYAYHVATYQVATPGPVGDLNAYSFAMQASSVSDTVGNFAPAGAITTASTPLLPVYADNDVSLSSDEGDLAGKSVVLSDEIGPKYQGAFNGEPKFRFSLSAASTLVLRSSSPATYRPQLYRDVNGNLQLEPSELIAPTGVGIYANLPAGDNYYINVQTYNGNGTFNNFKLNASFQSPGAVQIPPSSISGVVYTDANNNGTQDAGEAGQAGIPVNLTGTNDLGQAVNLTATSDANGAYTFTGLRPSDSKNGYKLTENPPSTIVAGTSQPGTLGGFPINKGEIWYVNVGPGVTGTGYLFGNAAPIANTSLSGSVYFDANNNGLRDAGEQGIANVSINVSGQGQDNISFNSSVVTDANGNYTVGNLVPGPYIISETQPAGVLDGKDTIGTLGGDTSLKNYIQSIPVSGVAGTGYLFGELSLPANAPPPPNATNQTNTTSQGNGTGGNVVATTPNITPVFDFSGGFAAAGTQVTYNGNAALSGNLAQIIPQTTGAAGSLYYSTPVNISRFNTQFSFNTTPGVGTGDGLTFVIQNNNANAIGGGGGGLGYFGMGKSVAIKFDLYNNAGEGSNSTGLYVNGAIPTNVGSSDLTPSGIDLHNGNTIQVSMGYDGTTLTVTLTDPTTGKTATQTYAINIAGTVGGSTAYVGFTGGSGGATSAQTVAGWTYAAAQATPAASPAAALPAARSASAPAAPAVYAQLIPGQGPFHAQSFTLNRDGTYKYIPVSSFVGTDSFTFQVVDSNGRVAAAKVTLIVTHVNQVPTMQTEMVHSTFIQQGTSTDIDLLKDMTDSDSTHLGFALTKVTGGTAKLLADGHTIRFTASKSFMGVASIGYSCSDGLGISYMSTTVCVTPVPKKPVANPDSAVTTPSTAVSIDALANDLDPEHVHLCLQSVQTPAHGTAYIDKQGSTDPVKWRVVYRPNFGFHGTDTFQYTLVDFYGTPVTGTISVKVLPGAGIGIDPSNSKLTALDVFGTSGNDTISVFKNAGNIAVVLNGILLGNYHPTGVIAVFGGDGNDTLDAHTLSQSVALFGEAGNDKLIGGSGKTLLVGGAGSDTLIAGAGATAIITGTADYATKGFAPLASLFSSATSLQGYVHDDKVVDQVFGGPGNNTFWATVSGKGEFDILHNRRVGENVFALS